MSADDAGRRLLFSTRTLLLEVLADGVVDDLGLVLRRDARQEFSLGLGNAELVERVLDIRRDVIPVVFRTIVGGAEVVEDVVEVDLAQVRGRPRGQRLALKNLQG